MGANPYFLLAGAVGFGLALWLAYDMGVETERGRAAVRQQAAVWDAAQAARLDAEAESDRRQAAALRNARRAFAAREAKLRGQADALRDARPECGWPDGRVRNLNAAIAAANAADAEAGSVLDELPGVAGPDGR